MHSRPTIALFRPRLAPRAGDDFLVDALRRDWAVVALFFTVAARWVSVFNLGNATIELVHITALIVLGATLISPRLFMFATPVLRHTWLFWMFYAAYLCITLGILSLTKLDRAASTLYPQVLYCACFAAVLVRLVLDIERHGARSLYLGARAGIVGFVVLMVVSASVAGLSPMEAISRLLQTGDIQEFNILFVKVIFNSLNQATLVGDATEFISTMRNEIGSCMVVLYVIMRAAKPTGRGWLHPGTSIDAVLTAVVVLAVIYSFSRSALLAFVLCLCVAIAYEVVSGRLSPIIPLVGAIALAVVGLILWELTPFVDVFVERVEDTTSAEQRLDQWESVAEIIDKAPIFGAGQAIIIDDRMVHNLFLSSWTHAGIFSFLSVVGFYLVLVMSWTTLAWRALKKPETWRLAAPLGWVLAIPVVPLLRVWLSGQAGNFSISMWVGAIAFLAFHTANHLSAPRAAEPKRQAPSPRPRARTILHP